MITAKPEHKHYAAHHNGMKHDDAIFLGHKSDNENANVGFFLIQNAKGEHEILALAGHGNTPKDRDRQLKQAIEDAFIPLYQQDAQTNAISNEQSTQRGTKEVRRGYEQILIDSGVMQQIQQDIDKSATINALASKNIVLNKPINTQLQLGQDPAAANAGVEVFSSREEVKSFVSQHQLYYGSSDAIAALKIGDKIRLSGVQMTNNGQSIGALEVDLPSGVKQVPVWSGHVDAVERSFLNRQKTAEGQELNDNASFNFAAKKLVSGIDYQIQTQTLQNSDVDGKSKRTFDSVTPSLDAGHLIMARTGPRIQMQYGKDGERNEVLQAQNLLSQITDAIKASADMSQLSQSLTGKPMVVVEPEGVTQDKNGRIQHHNAYGARVTFSPDAPLNSEEDKERYVEAQFKKLSDILNLRGPATEAYLGKRTANTSDNLPRFDQENSDHSLLMQKIATTARAQTTAVTEKLEEQIKNNGRVDPQFNHLVYKDENGRPGKVVNALNVGNWIAKNPIEAKQAFGLSTADKDNATFDGMQKVQMVAQDIEKKFLGEQLLVTALKPLIKDAKSPIKTDLGDIHIDYNPKVFEPYTVDVLSKPVGTIVRDEQGGISARAARPQSVTPLPAAVVGLHLQEGPETSKIIHNPHMHLQLGIYVPDKEAIEQFKEKEAQVRRGDITLQPSFHQRLGSVPELDGYRKEFVPTSHKGTKEGTLTAMLPISVAAATIATKANNAELNNKSGLQHMPGSTQAVPLTDAFKMDDMRDNLMALGAVKAQALSNGAQTHTATLSDEKGLKISQATFGRLNAQKHPYEHASGKDGVWQNSAIYVTQGAPEGLLTTMKGANINTFDLTGERLQKMQQLAAEEDSMLRNLKSMLPYNQDKEINTLLTSASNIARDHKDTIIRYEDRIKTQNTVFENGGLRSDRGSGVTPSFSHNENERNLAHDHTLDTAGQAVKDIKERHEASSKQWQQDAEGFHINLPLSPLVQQPATAPSRPSQDRDDGMTFG